MISLFPYPDFGTCPRCREQTWETNKNHSYCWNCDLFKDASSDNRDGLEAKRLPYKRIKKEFDESA